MGENEERQGNWQLHLSRKYDCTDGMSLYDLKYVRAGKVSSTLKGKSKGTKTRAFHCSSRVRVARSTLSTSPTQNIVRAGAPLISKCPSRSRRSTRRATCSFGASTKSSPRRAVRSSSSTRLETHRDAL